jgi:hypothetical protein
MGSAVDRSGAVIKIHRPFRNEKSAWSWQLSKFRVAFRNTLPPESPGRFTSVFSATKAFEMGTGPSSQLWPPTPAQVVDRDIIKRCQLCERLPHLGMLNFSSTPRKCTGRLFDTRVGGAEGSFMASATLNPRLPPYSSPTGFSRAPEGRHPTWSANPYHA